MSQFLGEKLYRIGKVSYQVGVSIQTVRNWIYSRKIQPVRTASGEHRIPESEIRRILGIPTSKK
ncbi:MAG: helix-turn-helix domain-containing protein [Promethearchaeota archaeon]